MKDDWHESKENFLGEELWCYLLSSIESDSSEHRRVRQKNIQRQ